MNKIIIIAVAGISIVAAFMIFPNAQVMQHNQTESDDSLHNSEQAITTESAAGDTHTQQTVSTHKDNHEAGFNFSPYVSKEMADEIRPYTSRSTKGLEVKIDKDGHEYVDLKKRWSHATISVVDENGVKHTGEWAPDN